MLDDYQSQVIACAALLLAIVIFRRLSSGARLALVIGTSGTGLLAAIAGLANSTMARIFG
jgi:thiamine pyrophosphate-dependent acetolactate synthase large subunit-like protein